MRILLFLLPASFVCGIFYVLFIRHIILFNFQTPTQHIQELQCELKTISMRYLNQQGYESREDVSIVWHQSDETKQLEIVLQQWLLVGFQEKMLMHLINVEMTLIAHGIAYLSLDRSLFTSTQATRTKLMITQTLIKTIKQYIPQLKGLVFLVHHEPMIDAHLDHTIIWPLDDFVSLRPS